MAIIHTRKGIPIGNKDIPMQNKRKVDHSKHINLVEEAVKIMKYGFYIINTDERVLNELIYEFKKEHGDSKDQELFTKEYEEMKKLSEKLVIPYWSKCNPTTVYKEPQNVTGLIPDCVGFRDLCSHVIEAKTSHSDFLNDKKKKGFVGDYFYYLTYPGIIKIEELDESIGLIYHYDNGKNICVKKAEYKDKGTKNTEIAILLSILRGTNRNAHTEDIK
jgi:hypothetical protein